MKRETINIPKDNKDNFHLEIINVEYQPIHYQREIEVILVMKGFPIITINGEQTKYKPLDIIVISPLDTHTILSEKEISQLLVLYLDPMFSHGYYPQLKNIRFIVNKLMSQNDELFIYTITELMKSYIKKDQYYQLNCAGFINIMIFDILNGCKYYEESDDKPFTISLKNKRLTAISEYVHNNYYKKIQLADLAENLSLSPTYLSRFIKKHLNRTFSDYVAYVRYVNAKNIIHELNYTLNDISAIVGFSDYRYMNKAFKKHLSMTPNEYRQILFTQPSLFTKEDTNKVKSVHDILSELNIFLRNNNLVFTKITADNNKN